MPLICPHCHIAQADENETCINCGQPLTLIAPDASLVDPTLDAEAYVDESAAGHDSRVAPDPTPPAQARRVSWRLPAAIAACLLLALAASALYAALRGPARRTPSAATTPAVAETAPPLPVLRPVPAPHPTPVAPVPPVKTAAETPGGAVPLTITLDSTREGRHVRVGEDVPLTALAHGRCATLTLSYRRGHGKKTMFLFIEGSLCSTTWTPTVPGRYEFMATALDDRQQAAASRPVEITVDEPAAPPAARAEPAQEEPPVDAAPPPRFAPQTRSEKTPQGTDRTPALTYHVAAAKFLSLRNATILSDALNRRGYQAVPEPMADAHGKAVYVVVTGAFRRPKEARAAALALQRSGYPAYFFGSR